MVLNRGVKISAVYFETRSSNAQSRGELPYICNNI